MNETAALIAALNTSWFSSGLSEKAQTRLAELGRRFTAEPGTELFREGEESDTFGILVHGRVALRTLVPERGDITILTVEPGDVYLWSALVPPVPRHVDRHGPRADRGDRLRRRDPPRRPARGLPAGPGALPARPRRGGAPPQRHPRPAPGPLRRRSRCGHGDPIGPRPGAPAGPGGARLPGPRRPPGPHRPPPRGRSPGHRPDRRRRGDRLRRDHLRRRPAPRRRRRAGARPLPPAPARRRAPLRLRRRAHGLEEVDLPVLRPAHPGHARTATRSPSPRRRPTPGRSPSSAPAPATSRRSASRTRSSPAPRSSTRTTSPAGRRCSSSRCSARPPRRPASAPRWAPVPRSRAATTSC